MENTPLNVFRFGDVTLAGMEQNERYENRGGAIVIGGDLGDARATSAWRGDENEDGEPTVILCNAEYRTSMDVSRDDARAYLEDVVRFSYDSIQSDTFAPR